MAAELQRTNPAELLYAEDFAETSLIEGRRGLRRRPLWEFEIDTARQQLNLQFGTRDLVGFGVENAPRGLCAAGCLLQYVKDTQRTALPHIRSITMERQQDSIIMDAATRRNLEITQNLAGGIENTLASVLDCTVTPMGSRMLKRWLHMPVRDTKTLLERQQTIGALQENTGELQPVLRQVGDLERILARLALRTARPRDLARMRHAFQQLPELRAQLAQVKSEPVQNLREKWVSLRSYVNCWNAPSLMPRRCWCAMAALSRRGTTPSSMSGERWQTAQRTTSTGWKFASAKSSVSIPLKSAITPYTAITFRLAAGRAILPPFTMFAVRR
jgi:DNA mismatch repair protein MutS